MATEDSEDDVVVAVAVAVVVVVVVEATAAALVGVVALDEAWSADVEAKCTANDQSYSLNETRTSSLFVDLRKKYERD